MARKLDILMFLEYKKNKRLNNIIFRGEKNSRMFKKHFSHL